jgi:hypothetical protein
MALSDMSWPRKKLQKVVNFQGIKKIGQRRSHGFFQNPTDPIADTSGGTNFPQTALSGDTASLPAITSPSLPPPSREKVEQDPP